MQRFDIIANQNKGIQIINNMTIYFIKIKKSITFPYATFLYHRKLEQQGSDGSKYDYLFHQN